jgi:hypothetical protein
MNLSQMITNAILSRLIKISVTGSPAASRLSPEDTKQNEGNHFAPSAGALFARRRRNLHQKILLVSGS